jgi:hypothetical protein
VDPEKPASVQKSKPEAGGLERAGKKSRGGDILEDLKDLLEGQREKLQEGGNRKSSSVGEKPKAAQASAKDGEKKLPGNDDNMDVSTSQPAGSRSDVPVDQAQQLLLGDALENQRKLSREFFARLLQKPEEIKYSFDAFPDYLSENIVSMLQCSCFPFLKQPESVSALSKLPAQAFSRCVLLQVSPHIQKYICQNKIETKTAEVLFMSLWNKQTTLRLFENLR